MYPRPTRPVMQFNGVGNNNNGVVTFTTPTVTPTTMRNIQQLVLDFVPYNQEEVGSFIPPLPLYNNNVSSSNCTYGSVRSDLGPVHVAAKNVKSIKRPAKSRGKNISSLSKGAKRLMMGGINTAPEEEERRRLKRERNKMAAAKCRKRRLDRSNTLQEETENLENTQSRLKGLIVKLLEEKEQLEFVLLTHNPFCNKGKANDINKNVPEKPKRPCSLPLNPVKQESLSTPNGGTNPDFRSCFGTGLTPANSPVITPSTVASFLTSLGENLKPSNSKMPLQLQPYQHNEESLTVSCAFTSHNS